MLNSGTYNNNRYVPVQTERSTSTRKNIRFNNELLSLIDASRGSQPFGSWVQEACKEKIKAKISNNKVTGR